MPDFRANVRARLAALRLSPARENEIVDELAQHLEDRWRELVAGGASEEDATRQALRDFRTPEGLQARLAQLRQAHVVGVPAPGASSGWLATDLWHDIRRAARIFHRQPAFAAAAVLTLALGIGAATAIFSVVYGVMLKPLPFHEPERLVGLYHRGTRVNLPAMNQGGETYLLYARAARAFEAIGAWDGGQAAITGRGEPERVETLVVTASALPLLGVRPELGRLFNAADDAPGAPLRVLLTHAYWRLRFGGARDIVGQSLRVDGRPAEIIGVLSQSFRFLKTSPALIAPMQLDPADPGGGFGMQALGRLRPGVTLAQANADIGRLIGQLPAWYKVFGLEPNVRPLIVDVTGGVERVLWILLAAVTVVLLIACGNVANLFLVRAESRQQELATRAALGASRGRLATALLAESGLLAAAAGLVALGFAQLAIVLLRRLAPATLPRADEIAIDPAVAGFATVASLAAAIIFGLVMLLRVRRPNVAAVKEGARGLSDGPARHRARNVLVVSQVALALVLMIVSALMVRTFMAMRGVDPGFVEPQQVQTFVVPIAPAVVETAEQVARVHERISERVRQVPGVTSVGLSSSITLDGEDNGNPLHAEDVPRAPGDVPPFRRFKAAAPGYFETMGNRLVAGRPITWADIHRQRRVVVISETLAREYWREPARAIGRRVRSGPDRDWYEVVGVAGDERDDGLNQRATAIVYWPMINDSYGRQGRRMTYVVRSSRVGTPGFLGDLQRAVWSVEPSIPLAAVQTLEDIRVASMAQTSFVMVMLALAASVALVLGIVGIYGVIAYAAAQRTREVGIRVALGAQMGDVRALFLRLGLRLTAAGTVIGIAASALLTRAMSALLFGVEAVDPATYVIVSIALGAVALLATYLPARRASRVNPLTALRAET